MNKSYTILLYFDGPEKHGPRHYRENHRICRCTIFHGFNRVEKRIRDAYDVGRSGDASLTKGDLEDLDRHRSSICVSIGPR